LDDFGPLAAAGGGSSTIVDCPKQIVGRIIGKGGETINQLQQRSGTKMQVDQTSMPAGEYCPCLQRSLIFRLWSICYFSGQPCKVMITGPPQNVQMAVQLVTELINSGGMGRGGPMGGGGGLIIRFSLI
jgi:far upstream element-binding protein